MSADGWLVQTPSPPTAAQITNARLAAAAAGLSIETKNSIPSVGVIISWATVFGIVLALGILAMTLGLIRSETAGDLHTLAATGASGWTRRTLTAVTAEPWAWRARSSARWRPIPPPSATPGITSSMASPS